MNEDSRAFVYNYVPFENETSKALWYYQTKYLSRRGTFLIYVSSKEFLELDLPDICARSAFGHVITFHICYYEHIKREGKEKTKAYLTKGLARITELERQERWIQHRKRILSKLSIRWVFFRASIYPSAKEVDFLSNLYSLYYSPVALAVAKAESSTIRVCTSK
jgi:hypothetical protein